MMVVNTMFLTLC